MRNSAFAEREQTNKVFGVWDDVQGEEFWSDNESACSAMCAMLYAASKSGNVTCAAGLLDQMERRGKALNILDWNQASNACKVACSPNAAAYLFKELTARGLNATVVTYSLVIASHAGRPLDEILPYVDEMTACGVEPSSLFVEELVCAILGRRLSERQWGFVNTLQKARSMIATTPPAHQEHALRVLDEAVGQGRELSSLMKLFRKALAEES